MAAAAEYLRGVGVAPEGEVWPQLRALWREVCALQASESDHEGASTAEDVRRAADDERQRAARQAQRVQQQHAGELAVLRGQLQMSEQLLAESKAVLEVRTSEHAAMREGLHNDHDLAISRLAAELKETREKHADSIRALMQGDGASTLVKMQELTATHRQELSGVESRATKAAAEAKLRVSDLNVQNEDLKVKLLSEFCLTPRLGSPPAKRNISCWPARWPLSSARCSRAIGNSRQKCGLWPKRQPVNGRSTKSSSSASWLR
jgi:hypothetical protein